MSLVEIALPAPHLPALTSLGAARLQLLGDAALLATLEIALLGSVRCPPSLLLATHDQAHLWRGAGVGGVGMSIVSGFQSPLEEEALLVLLRGRGPLVIALARTLDTLRLPKAWRDPLQQGRLAVVSVASVGRANAKSRQQRNELVAALAPLLFIPYAAPDGKTLALAHASLAQGKRVQTFTHAHNQPLLDAGAEGVPIPVA